MGCAAARQFMRSTPQRVSRSSARRRDRPLPAPAPDAHKLAAVCGARLVLVGLGASLRSLAGAVEELDGVGDHAHRLPALLLGGLPLAPLQPSVNRDAATPAHVAADGLAGRAVDADVEVVGPLDELAVGVLVARVARDTQPAHAGSRGQRTQLGVAGQTADENDAVDREIGHRLVSTLFDVRPPRRPSYASAGTVLSAATRSSPSPPVSAEMGTAAIRPAACAWAIARASGRSTSGATR